MQVRVSVVYTYAFLEEQHLAHGVSVVLRDEEPARFLERLVPRVRQRL